MGVCLVLQAPERLFNFALCLCYVLCVGVGVWAGRLSPLPRGRKNFRVGRRFLGVYCTKYKRLLSLSILFNILYIVS